MTFENEEVEEKNAHNNVRISAVTITFEDSDAGAGDAWRLGIVSANAYEEEHEDGVHATRITEDDVVQVPWSTVPEDLRNHACEIFRSLAFTPDEIKKEAPLDDEE